jgi:DNA mismatch endonuclease (patch repair protein)
VKALSYRVLLPASERASAAARASSKKCGTKPERALRKELWRNGLRYRTNVSKLPGIPDILFPKAHVAVFCDGDFWHGKDWRLRKPRLQRGTNPGYWVSKIERNIERDKKNNRELRKRGWIVLRFWESEIFGDLDRVVAIIQSRIRQDIH